MKDFPVMMCGGVPFSALPLWAVKSLTGPAVYLLCARDGTGVRRILFIGDTAAIEQEFGPQNDTWRAALALGLNEVHVHSLSPDRDNRHRLTERLRSAFSAPLHQAQAAFARAQALLRTGAYSKNARTA